jgi:hypothetical protein
MKIIFKNLADFRKRFPPIFQNSSEEQSYEFEFLDKETEDEFNNLMKTFECKTDLHKECNEV